MAPLSKTFSAYIYIYTFGYFCESILEIVNIIDVLKNLNIKLHRMAILSGRRRNLKYHVT